jgi:hypothetical protein
MTQAAVRRSRRQRLISFANSEAARSYDTALPLITLAFGCSLAGAMNELAVHANRDHLNVGHVFHRITHTFAA